MFLDIYFIFIRVITFMTKWLKNECELTNGLKKTLWYGKPRRFLYVLYIEKNMLSLKLVVHTTQRKHNIGKIAWELRTHI